MLLTLGHHLMLVGWQTLTLAKVSLLLQILVVLVVISKRMLTGHLLTIEWLHSVLGLVGLILCIVKLIHSAILMSGSTWFLRWVFRLESGHLLLGRLLRLWALILIAFGNKFYRLLWLANIVIYFSLRLYSSKESLCIWLLVYKYSCISLRILWCQELYRITLLVLLLLFQHLLLRWL